MTTFNKVQLATFFQQGDVPTGTDYNNLIQSQVNIAETALQSMAGPLATTEIATPLVSATAINITGTFNIAGKVSANGLNVTTDVSAVQGSVYASAVRSTTGYFGGTIPIVSALGTTRATAAPITAYITRGQGVTDGSATGFILPVPAVSWLQYLIYENAASANLYPAGADYQINALVSGTPFVMAGNTTYTIIHKTTSAYAVR